MKKLNIKILALVIPLALLACRSADEDYDDDKDNLYFSVGVKQDVLSTRGMAADIYNKGLPNGGNIDVFVYDVNGGNTATQKGTTMPWIYTTTGDADAEGVSTLIPADANKRLPKYPDSEGLSDRSAFIFAVFPSSATANPDGNYTFSVALDQTIVDNIKASDLMSTEMIVQPRVGGQSVRLPLIHKMAKIRVTFTPSGDLTSNNMPTSFDVINVFRTLTITPSTAILSSGNQDQTTEENPMKANITEAFFLPPQTISAGTAFLKFNLPGTSDNHFNGISGAYFRPSNDMTFEANTVYDINILVDVDFVTATTTVMPWSKESLSFDKYIL